MSLLLDSLYLSWMGPVYMAWKKQQPDRRLFTFDYPAYSCSFRLACKQLGLKNLVPYQTRHSGASIDRARNLRDLRAIQERGSWRQPRSVTRYDKHARLAAQFLKHPSSFQCHALACEKTVEAIILYQRTVASHSPGLL